MKGLRVFVTQELYPFTAGGIGRVVGNILAESSKEELARTAIVYLGRDLSSQRFKGVYPEPILLAVGEEDYALADEEGRDYPIASAYSDSPLRLKSVLALQALRRLERDHGPLGYVEFTDWGGIAFPACQEKRLGRAFRQATLAVRLHSTDSILTSFEQRFCDASALALYDLERKALADCDLVVAQLQPVADTVRDFFDFDDADWTPRLRLHAPPVKISGPIAGEVVRPNTSTPITFSSKIQHFKRPETFVRAVAEFLLRHPRIEAPVYLLAHTFDESYLGQVKALVPDALLDRFHFLAGVSGDARDSMIARSVCLFPSVYESFCLAAYEASMSGALCVVNANNPAFGEGTPWRHGENCVSFDGSSDGLVAALESVYFSTHRLRPVTAPVDSFPGELDQAASPSFAPNSVRVTAVVVSNGSGVSLAATLDSLAGSSHEELEILVADGGRSDVVAQSILERLEQERHSGRIRVLRCGVAATPGVVLSRAVEAVSSDYILFLRAGDVVSPDFIVEASGALQREPAFGVATAVTGQLKPAASFDQGVLQAYDNYWLVMGEARAQGLYVNRYSPTSCMLRAGVARRIGFRGDLEHEVWWDFHQRATSQRVRYIVSSSVDLATEAGAATPVSPFAAKLRRHNVVRNKYFHFGSNRLPMFVIDGLGGSAEATAVVSNADYHELQGYRSSETVALALGAARFLERRAPRLLRLAKRAVSWGGRVVRGRREGR